LGNSERLCRLNLLGCAAARWEVTGGLATAGHLTYATWLPSQICARVTLKWPRCSPQKFERIMTAIKDNVVTPVAVVAEHASHKAKPISVLTNVNLEERDQLLDLGFSFQMMDTASVRGLSGDDLDVDIVVLDWSVLDVSSIEATAQFSTRSIPILFINSSASLTKQANCGAGVVEGPSGADSMVNALKLAAAFVRLNQPAANKEGLTCGKLVLQNPRGFWNGTDLDLTAGEYRVIELLASRPGQYFPHRAICGRLRNHEGFISGTGPNSYWGNVRSAIKRIRNKFRAFDPTFQEIETYTAFGYRWRKPD
jgi:two-component system, OmpR family, response regulator ChvI